MGAGGTLYGKLTIDLSGKSGSAGRDALVLNAGGGASDAVIVLNKPTLALWDSPQNTYANLQSGAATIDLTGRSGVAGTDGLYLTADSNPAIAHFGIIINKPKVVFWSTPKGAEADAAVGDLDVSGQLTVGGQISGKGLIVGGGEDKYYDDGTGRISSMCYQSWGSAACPTGGLLQCSSGSTKRLTGTEPRSGDIYKMYLCLT